MTIKSISIENIRGFTSQATLPLKPITLIVGSNSSGKSTLARLLPLLKQSIETKTKGPILWYGPYVDYGSYAEVKPSLATDPETTVCLEYTLSKQDKLIPYTRLHPIPIYNEISLKILFAIGIHGDTGAPYTSSISLSTDDHMVSFSFDCNGHCKACYLNNEILSLSSDIQLSQDSSLFTLYLREHIAGKRDDMPPILWPFQLSHIEIKELREHVNTLFHGSTRPNRRASFMRNLGVGSLESLKKALISSRDVTQYTLNNIKSRVQDVKWITRLQGLLIASHSATLINMLNDEACSALRRSSYLGPVRATASRFYRQRDLSTEEIDPQGANIAMYLSSISDDDRENFSAWCAAEMGFTVSVEISRSHISVYIGETKGGVKYNIADMGFGFSQVLPLLVSLWSSKQHTNFQRVGAEPWPSRPLWGVELPAQFFHTVEQPELHLHPRMQAKLADLYVALATSKNDLASNYFILETHSETIVNRIGELVYLGKIDQGDVIVLLTSKEDGACLVTESSYSSDGILQDWPYGFFLPDVIT